MKRYIVKSDHKVSNRYYIVDTHTGETIHTEHDFAQAEWVANIENNR